jgi:hypothetical protein
LFEFEKITKIGTDFIQHSFGLRFAAVVISAYVVKRTIKAAMQISSAGRALRLPADKKIIDYFFLTFMANFHILAFIQSLPHSMRVTIMLAMLSPMAYFAGASISAPIMVIIGKVSVNHGNNRPHDSLFYSKAILMLCFMLVFLSWQLV